MGTAYVEFGRLEYSGTEVVSLLHVGTLPGVIIDNVAGINGPGAGLLEFENNGTQKLRWTAPGDSTAGDWVTISGATEILFAADYAGWVEVSIESDHLPAGGMAVSVYLSDSYASTATPGDVEAADALAGDVRTWQLTFENEGVSNVSAKVYLGGASAGTFEVSANNVDWYSPTTFGTAVDLGTVNAASSATIYLRETIASSTGYDPSVLLAVLVAFQVGSDDWNTVEARGLYRVWNAPEYRFYRDNSSPPEEGDSPYATASSLPATPADTFADGTWYLACSYFNGVLDSGFLPVGPRGKTYHTLTVASGAATDPPPATIQQWRLEPQPAGVVRVVGCYYETGDGRAEEWSISYTTNGTTPDQDAPEETVEFRGTAGLEMFSYDLPAQADATVVKVLLQVRRNDGTEGSPVWVYSEDATVETVTVDQTGPDAVEAADVWPGIPMETQ